MASLLVDLDDLSYIDDIDEELEALGVIPDFDADQTNHNSYCNNKTSKRAKQIKNQPIGENLKINSDTAIINELRQERQQKLKSQKNAKNEGFLASSVVNDTEKLISDLTNQIGVDKKSMLKELREDRRKSQIEQKSKHRSQLQSVDSVKEIKNDKMDNEGNVKIVTVELHTVDTPAANNTEEKTSKQQSPIKAQNQTPVNTEMADNNLYKPKKGSASRDASLSPTRPTVSSVEAAQGSTTTEKGSLYARIASSEYDGDIDEELNIYNDDVFLDDTLSDRSNLSPDISGAESLPAEKEMSKHEKDTDNCSKQTAKDIENLKKVMSSSKASDNENNESILKSRNFSDLNERPSDISSSSSKSEKKKKIRIVVTNEEGIDEHVEEISQQSKVSRRRMRRRDDTSPDTDSSSGAAPLNYMKKVTEERKTSVVDELAKKKKTKPFHRLQRLKRGSFEVGIAGDTKRCNIKAIALIKDKRMVMFDRNNKCLKLFDKEFVPLDRLNIHAKFCGLTTVSKDTIAITLPEEKKLQLYHIDKNSFVPGRVHPMEAEFYSVYFYKSKFYLMKRMPKPGLTEHDDWQIVVMDFYQNGDKVKILRTFSPGHQDCALIVNSEGVYMTNKLENEILHIGLDGSFKLKYKIQMSLPIGITCDKFGNIYVCGGAVTSFIEICKFNLKTSRVIYHKTSSDPVAMCFDKQDSMLFVCDKINGNIMKYKIEHSGLIQGLMKSFAMGSNVSS